MNFLADEDTPPGRASLHEDETPAPGISTAEFRARQITLCLSTAQRKAIAKRPRFYSMPWLRRADEPNPDDELP